MNKSLNKTALCLGICTVVNFGFIYFLTLRFLLTLLKFRGRTFGYLATFSTRHLHAAPMYCAGLGWASVSRAAPALPCQPCRAIRAGPDILARPAQPWPSDLILILIRRQCTLYLKLVRNSKIRNGMKCQNKQRAELT